MNLTEKLKQFLYNTMFDTLPNQYSICEENNILGRYDEQFLLTKTENFVAGIELHGINYNSATSNDILDLAITRVNALNAISDDIELRIVAKRREFYYNRQYDIHNQYAQMLINEWEGREKVFTNSYYLILETRNKGAKGFFEKKKLELTTSIKEDKNHNNITYTNKIVVLRATIERFLQTLSIFEPKQLSSIQLVQIYAEYINGVFIPITAPIGILSDSYISSTIAFKKDYFIQDFNGEQTFGRFIGVKAYDNEKITSIPMSVILHSNIEIDVYLSIEPIAKERAQSKIKSKLKLAPQIIKSQLIELKEMIDSDRLLMQHFSYTILVRAKSKEELNTNSQEILNELKNAGIIAVIETLNLQPTFFSIFPNKAFLNARRRLHTSKTISSMILFEKEYLGKTSNSWGNTPVAIFKNQSMSPYLFNFHADESDNVVGHTMIIGGTGAGKTTLLSFLMANLFKYDIDILALDRINGLFAVTEFLNGEYNQGENFYINPFTLPDDPENITFLSSWLAAMVGVSLEAKSAEEAEKLKAIEKVVQDLYHSLTPQNVRFSLKDIMESITKTGDSHIQIQLSRYLENPLFNNQKDSLQFDKKLTTLNMDFIVENDKDASLIAQYLFHKMIYNAKNKDKGFFIFIDEFKSYLANETFNERINLTLTQARKVNGVMAMAFQDMHQLDGVKNAQSFIRNLAHIIIFPTKDLDVFENYNIHLAENEKNFLLHTGQNERKILVKNLITNQSNIVDVNLAKLGKYLKILSSDSKVVQNIKRLQTSSALWKESFSMVNIYSFIMGLFIEISDKFVSNIVPAIAQALHLASLLNFIFMLLTLIFVAKKIQEGDFINWKTISQLLIFMLYLGFFNWVANNPTEYMKYFGAFINYPADTLTNYITKATQTMQITPNSSEFKGGIDWLIQQSFETAVRVAESALPKISLFGGWQGSVITFICAIAFFLITMIFIIVIMLIIIVASIQITIWKGLGVIFVALMFFAQTRQMVGKYILMLVGLTMYKPMLMTIVFFNYQVNQFVITNLPSDAAFKGNAWEYVATQAGNAISVIGYLALAIVGVFISTYLVKQVPDFINNIIGAGGGVGKAIANMGEQAMAKTTGALAAAGIALGGASQLKSAYQSAGGGIGGLISGVANALSGGATSGAGKHTKLGKQIGGKVGGEAINDKLNQSKFGSKANNAVAKGIETGSSAIKNLSDKYSGKAKQ